MLHLDENSSPPTHKPHPTRKDNSTDVTLAYALAYARLMFMMPDGTGIDAFRQ